MKRAAGSMVLLAALGGCVTTEGGPNMDPAPWSRQVACNGANCGGGSPLAVAGLQGSWGQPVPMASPYSCVPNAPTDTEAARAMLAQSVPLDLVQQAKFTPGA